MILDYAQLVKWRREFHRFPEEGWTEFWTTTRIADYLESMGFEILLGSQIIHRDFVRGRNNILIEKALVRAIEYGANQKWLDKMEQCTGCVALLDTGRPGKTVALRFDIDCSIRCSYRTVFNCFTTINKYFCICRCTGDGGFFLICCAPCFRIDGGEGEAGGEQYRHKWFHSHGFVLS